MPTSVPLIFIGVPILLVVVFLLVGISHLRVARRMATVPAGWVPAGGMVTDQIAGMESSGFSDGGFVYMRRPIVTFRTADGRDITFTSRIAGTFMPKPGTAVEVFYDPADPQQARIAPNSIPATTRRLATVVWVVILLIGIPLVVVFEIIGFGMLRNR